MDTTVNDEDVGMVLFIIIRGVGLDTIGFVDVVGVPDVDDDDNNISVIEFIRSFKKEKKRYFIFVFN